MDDDAVADEANLGRAGDLTFLDIGAANDDFRRRNDFTDFGTADDFFFVFLFQHPFDSRFDVVDGIVNDAVHTHVDFFMFCHLAGCRIGADVEADNQSVRCRSQHDIRFIDGANTGVDDGNTDFVALNAHEGLAQGFDGTLDVAFDDERQFLQFTLLDLVEQVIQGNFGIDVELGRTFLFQAFFGNRTSRLFVGDVEDVASFRHVIEAEDFDRNRRFGFLDAFAAFVVHGADLTKAGADDDCIADAESPFLDEDGSDRTAAFIQLGFDNNALGRTVRVGLEVLHFSQDEDVFQEVIEADLLVCRNGDHDGVAAPIFTDEAVFCQLLHDVFRISAFLIDFVDSDDDGDASRFGMVNRFDGLRHDTVVSCDDEDSNICDLGTAGTHGRESFVTRCIHEGDLLALIADLISPDMLRNAAGFVAGDIGLADSVEEARLAVVDVAHDGDDRRTSLEGFRRINDFFDFRRIFRRCFFRDSDAEFIGNKGRRLKIQFLVDCRHDAAHEKLLHDFAYITAQAFCKVLDDDRFRQFNGRRIILLLWSFLCYRCLTLLVALVFVVLALVQDVGQQRMGTVTTVILVIAVVLAAALVLVAVTAAVVAVITALGMTKIFGALVVALLALAALATMIAALMVLLRTAALVLALSSFSAAVRLVLPIALILAFLIMILVILFRRIALFFVFVLSARFVHFSASSFPCLFIFLFMSTLCFPLGTFFKGCVEDGLHIGVNTGEITGFDVMIFQRLDYCLCGNAVFFCGFIYSFRHLVTPFYSSRFTFSMAPAKPLSSTRMMTLWALPTALPNSSFVYISTTVIPFRSARRRYFSTLSLPPSEARNKSGTRRRFNVFCAAPSPQTVLPARQARPRRFRTLSLTAVPFATVHRFRWTLWSSRTVPGDVPYTLFPGTGCSGRDRRRVLTSCRSCRFRQRLPVCGRRGSFPFCSSVPDSRHRRASESFGSSWLILLPSGLHLHPLPTWPGR